ncbi:uncharacterized protein [Rutidosis leptorrhynchoides]|uniref:uncharacterized protein n=1 Tax=Rutidosis leptorrhynchoides TaxID=125765 RepID=UPI003A98E41B
MVNQANKHRQDIQFEVGEWVYVRLRIYRQVTVAARHSHKLSKRYFGPFKILRRIGKVAYQLKLPTTSRIHPVFHVSLLRRCHGDPQINRAPLPTIVNEDLPVLEPAAILGHRTHGSVPQALVAWQGCTSSEATWENIHDLKDLFPEFVTANLEDKVDFTEGGIDSGPAHNTTSIRPTRTKITPARYLN